MTPNRRLAWRSAAVTLLGYETAAFITKGRVPFVTDVVRGLPRPLRWMVIAVISAAVADHLDSQRIF